jgi:hypothetical protein
MYVRKNNTSINKARQEINKLQKLLYFYEGESSMIEDKTEEKAESLKNNEDFVKALSMLEKPFHDDLMKFKSEILGSVNRLESANFNMSTKIVRLDNRLANLENDTLKNRVKRFLGFK